MGITNKIVDWQLDSSDGKLLLGLALQSAVLDIVSDRATLACCLQLLETPPNSLRDLPMGRFGTFEVTLNHDHDDSVSIFIDGPEFLARRTQSAAIWVDKASLCDVLRKILNGG